MVRIPCKISLLFFVLFVSTSTTACAIAKYDLVRDKAPEESTGDTVAYDPPMSFIIPRYYIMHWCGKFGTTPCRDLAGEQLYNGVGAALSDAGMGQGNFVEHLPTTGLACFVTVKQESPEDYTSRLWSMATAFIVPAYTRREYVLSYDVYFDAKKMREYRFHITEKALNGLIMWLFAPTVLILQDATIGQEPGTRGSSGPMAYAVHKATGQFLQDAFRDGFLRHP